MMPPSADVVVVGAGIIGSAVTYYLAKHGLQVTQVDRGDILSGTSRACMGGVQMSTKTLGAKLALAMESMALHRDLQDELGYDCEYRFEGSMIVAQDDAEVDYVRHRTEEYVQSGVNCSYLDGSETRFIQPALGKQVLGSLYSPGDCAVSPLRLVLAFSRRAQEMGAQLRTYCPVTGIAVEKDRIVAVTTPQGDIATRTVVVAAGPWSAQVAHLAGVDLPIVPRKGEILVTEASARFVKGLVLTASYLLSKKMPAQWGDLDPTLLAGIVTAQEAHGQCLIGSTRQFLGYDTTSSFEGVTELMRQATRLFPAYRGLHVIRTYAGLRPAAPDGLPILERTPALPDLVIASGHEGDAIALAPITGLRIAQLITGQLDPAALQAFSSARFSPNIAKGV